MRPWFTLTIIAIIAGCLLSFWIVIDFALLNRVMFETPFTITVRVPFVPSWSHRWTEVQFMYILTISVLLGAGLVAFTTLIFDTKRALKVRSMRKELVRLQKALEEAQAKLPPPTVSEEESMVPDAEGQESLPSEIEKSSNGEPVTPQDIAHSFEDVVEEGDFLKVAQQRVDDELERHGGQRPEGDIRAIVTGSSEEVLTPLIQEGDSSVTEEERPVESMLNASVALETEQQEYKESREDSIPPAADEEAQPNDGAPKQATEQEISLSDQGSKDGGQDSDEQTDKTQQVVEQKGAPVMEAEIVDDHASSKEDNLESAIVDDNVSEYASPLKKSVSDSQSQGD